MASSSTYSAMWAHSTGRARETPHSAALLYSYIPCYDSTNQQILISGILLDLYIFYPWRNQQRGSPHSVATEFTVSKKSLKMSKLSREKYNHISPTCYASFDVSVLVVLILMFDLQSECFKCVVFINLCKISQPHHSTSIRISSRLAAVAEK